LKSVLITGHSLTLEELVAVSRENAVVELSQEAKDNILASRAVVDRLVEEEAVVYGITTGFGKFSDVTISSDECKLLQKNLIITHAVGAGDPFPVDVVRAMMLLRVNNLAKGFSGVRLVTVETLIAMLNKGVTPLVPEKGSLGASGDLAPLSHMVLPMLGLGEALYEGRKLCGADAMAQAGIPTLELVAKEGLALINGTQAMTSVGALALVDGIRCMKLADIAAALQFLLATPSITGQILYVSAGQQLL
jgi:histidine ammonia-lyase